MKPVLTLIAAIGVTFAAAGAIAADYKPWPFNKQEPHDPALGMLMRVEKVTVTPDEGEDGVITVTAEAVAPREGYTDLSLVDRPGQLDDRIFSFEVRGRPPQEPSKEEVPTTVTAGGTYKNAPIENIDVVEIYAAENCMAYSLKQKKSVPCTSKQLKQDEQI